MREAILGVLAGAALAGLVVAVTTLTTHAEYAVWQGRRVFDLGETRIAAPTRVIIEFDAIDSIVCVQRPDEEGVHEECIVARDIEEPLPLDTEWDSPR